MPAPGRTLNYTTTGWTTMLVFGDSTVDPGNNNRLQTVMRANFLPYGASFLGGRPTGRFSNGRLITDILGTDTHTAFLASSISLHWLHQACTMQNWVPKQTARGIMVSLASK
jgi:hypothetical protein